MIFQVFTVVFYLCLCLLELVQVLVVSVSVQKPEWWGRYDRVLNCWPYGSSEDPGDHIDKISGRGLNCVGTGDWLWVGRGERGCSDFFVLRVVSYPIVPANMLVIFALFFFFKKRVYFLNFARPGWRGHVNGSGRRLRDLGRDPSSRADNIGGEGRWCTCTGHLPRVGWGEGSMPAHGPLAAGVLSRRLCLELGPRPWVTGARLTEYCILRECTLIGDHTPLFIFFIVGDYC